MPRHIGSLVEGEFKHRWAAALLIALIYLLRTGKRERDSEFRGWFAASTWPLKRRGKQLMDILPTDPVGPSHGLLLYPIAVSASSLSAGASS